MFSVTVEHYRNQVGSLPLLLFNPFAPPFKVCLSVKFS